MQALVGLWKDRKIYPTPRRTSPASEGESAQEDRGLTSF